MSPSSIEGRLTLEQVLARLEPILEGVIAPHAEAVDREGRFPAETVAALGEAGLLGLVTPTEHGGLGLGVVEGMTRVFYPEASSVVVFVVMVIVLILRPAGLFGKEA